MNDDNSTPLTVSVVMCTYNGEQFLREQMDSILAQDYPLHEIIVQDDRSTDDTWDILQTYAKAHPGLFKLFRNDEQLGFNRNFHTALLRATGQYVAISDQDDIWFPQKISKQVAAIGNADLCFFRLLHRPALHTATAQLCVAAHRLRTHALLRLHARTQHAAAHRLCQRHQTVELQHLL